MQHRPRPLAPVPRPNGPKPTLPMYQLPHYRVKQRHLEAYLATVYRMAGFDLLRSTGAMPGECPEYQVSAVLPPAHNAPADAERIRRGNRTHNVGLILNVLCLDGYIPAGRYTIDTHPEPAPGQVYRDLLIQTEDPAHPACAAFRREHQHDRAFTLLAAKMDRVVQEQRALK